MSLTDCSPTSLKTNSDGKRLNKAASALFHGGRAHAHGLLPWQSVLCRPGRYKLEFAGSFDLKIHPLLLFAAKLCHPVSRRDLCSRIKRIKMLSYLLLSGSCVCSECTVSTHRNLRCRQEFWICADTISPV